MAMNLPPIGRRIWSRQWNLCRPRTARSRSSSASGWKPSRAVSVRSTTPRQGRVLAFGTYNDVISGIDQWVATQWENVWPKTTDFRFVLEQTSVLASRDGMMATVIAPWTSTGYHPDGHPFPRPGRATLVFSGNADGWLCAHSPLSRNRGLPQPSQANRRRRP